MNEQHSPIWDVLSVLSNIVAVVMSAAFGWLIRKFTTIEQRIEDMETDLNDRAQLAAMNIVRLEAYHAANTDRLTAIENVTRDINKKLDRLIERGKGKRGDDE